MARHDLPLEIIIRLILALLTALIKLNIDRFWIIIDFRKVYG